MKKIFKLGKVNLVSHKNEFQVILITDTKAKAQSLLSKIINLGYKNAKTHSN